MKMKIFYLMVSFVILFSSVYALNLGDISSNLGNTISNFLNNFFGENQVNISCPGCSLSTCSCSINVCAKGTLDIYTNSECSSIPSYMLIFDNSHASWQPEAAGNYFVRAFCDDGKKSECVGITVIGEEDCRMLYWFDDEHYNECGYKKFCGAFMYESLRTFENLDACEDALNSPGSFSVSSVYCDEDGCNLHINSNPFSENLVLFFELVDENSGKIYYTSNLNIESSSIGQKKIVISQVRSCPSGTSLELLVLVYKQSDLNYRIKRVKDESFIC